MDWGFLFFFAEPWFVIPWYLVGIVGFFYVAHDIRRYNTPLKKAMKWAWPIIVLFFSVVGLGLYFGTARAPGIARKSSEKAKKKAHLDYEKNMFRRVNGAVIHCVAGDGLGIMTAMVIARLLEMSFWQEFWFEYLVGFLFGWFIFQYKSMTMMTDSKLMALAMAFRAEFMSMMTVMAGMGAVMGYVTPLAVTEQPKPLTYAFWGFGTLGLMVGYVFTWPMNYIMVKIGWKHGMGGMQAGEKKQVKGSGPRYALMAGMYVLGAVALVIPAWLVEVRDGTPVEPSVSSAGTDSSAADMQQIGDGLRRTLQASVRYLDQDKRSHAAHAIDAAHRAADVAHKAVPGPAFETALKDIEAARHDLHMGSEEKARQRLASAARQDFRVPAMPASKPLSDFRSATVLDPQGVMVGEITEVTPDKVRVAVGGARDVWGFVDLGAGRTEEIPADAVVTGPDKTIGMSMVTIARLEPEARRGEK